MLAVASRLYQALCPTASRRDFTHKTYPPIIRIIVLVNDNTRKINHDNPSTIYESLGDVHAHLSLYYNTTYARHTALGVRNTEPQRITSLTGIPARQRTNQAALQSGWAAQGFIRTRKLCLASLTNSLNDYDMDGVLNGGKTGARWGCVIL